MCSRGLSFVDLSEQGPASCLGGLLYPLILDGHGDEVIDANGVVLPLGRPLRPLRPAQWHYTSFAHVMRFLPPSNAVAPVNVVLPQNP